MVYEMTRHYRNDQPHDRPSQTHKQGEAKQQLGWARLPDQLEKPPPVRLSRS